MHGISHLLCAEKHHAGTLARKSCLESRCPATACHNLSEVQRDDKSLLTLINRKPVILINDQFWRLQKQNCPTFPWQNIPDFTATNLTNYWNQKRHKLCTAIGLWSL